MFNSHQLHRFAIRKYAIGVCSVMVASLLFLGTSQVSADQLGAAAEAGTEQVADNPDQLQDQELEAEASGHQPAEANQALANEPVATLTTETVIAPTTEPSSPQPLDQVGNQPQETKMEPAQPASVPATQSVSVAEASKPAEQAVEEVAPAVKEQPVSTSKEEKEQVGSALIAKEVSEPQASLTTSRPEPSALTTNLAPAKFTRGTGFRSFGMTRSATPSGVIGDDYPDKWKHLDPNRNLDSWNLYVRNCTSFAAYRLSSVNGFELPLAFGDAGVWGENARREGYRVDNIPARGSIAWALPSATNSAYGHVAWVAAVNGDMVTVEEYNYNYLRPFTYVTRTVPKSAFTGYIHFKDLNHGAVATPPTTTTTHGLPAQGTYTFTQRTGVKNEPIMASPDKATYDVGESVNYDKVLENDNHVWLSYTNYSGSRSYVAVKALTPAKPRPTTGKIQVQTTNPQTGDFDVIISDVSHASGIREVQVPVWSDKGGQDDIVWYRAQLQGDSTYKVSVQAGKHKHDTGTYHIHLYYLQDDGKQVGAGATTTQVAPQPVTPSRPTSGNIQIQNKNTQTGDFEVVITDVYHAPGVREVQVPIWSDKGGQDDIVWYKAQHQGGSTYKISVKASQHKNDTGTYHIHLYYLQNDGKQQFVAGTTTQVERQQVVSTPAPAIPSKGVYRFTKTLPIKNQASMSSATIDYYYAGETVNYDRVLTAEGRQWLSYMSRSGLRRYVPLT